MRLVHRPDAPPRAAAQVLPAALWLGRAALAGVLAAAAATKLSVARPELVFAWTASVPQDLAGPMLTLVAVVEFAAAIAIVAPPWNGVVAEASRMAAARP